jgi:hypothetical protein
MHGARAAAAALALLLPALPAPGCTPDSAPLVLGRPGRGPGEFDRPRAIAAAGGAVAVLDLSGRLQRFSADGAFLSEHRVSPPDARRGFPLGVLLLPGGDALVVHTHDAALVRYDAAGRETARFGEAGAADGRLGMPQRACLRGGELVVSDFGHPPNRRVQAFAPDGRFLRRLGGPGTDAPFERALGVAVDRAGVLWVADSAHRLYRMDPDTGRVLSVVGREGGRAGEVRWPSGVAAHPGGGVVVAESGNHRLQRFDGEGRSLGVYGGAGSEPGRFRGPWDLAVDPPWLFVADTDNHRVQRLRLDAVPWSPPPEESP